MSGARTRGLCKTYWCIRAAASVVGGVARRLRPWMGRALLAPCQRPPRSRSVRPTTSCTSPRRGLLVAAVAAALAAGVAPPAARAGDDAPDGPVFFRSPDGKTAARIRNAIGLFGNPAPSDRQRARDTLAEIGIWSVPPLLEEMKEGSAQIRSNSVLVLFRLPDARALAPLRQACAGDGRGEWPPILAALALGRLRDADPATFRVFREAIASRDNERRKVAVALAGARLARVRAAEALALEESILDGRSSLGDVRDAALLALGFFPASTVELSRDGAGEVPAAPLRAGLKDNTTGTRLSSVLALALARRDAFHPVFAELQRSDGDANVRCAALLAMGARRDDETTAVIARVLESVRSTTAERAMAAYLLVRRADPRALDALVRTATASAAPDVAAAAIVALGDLNDPRATSIVRSKLSDRNAGVRAAAAVACTRLRADADLALAEKDLVARLQQGETDASTRLDMKKALEEIRAIVEERRVRAAGGAPEPRKAPAWSDSEAGDLARSLDRDEKDALLDVVNFRVHQLMGIAGISEYRPGGDPKAANPDTADGVSSTTTNRVRRDHEVRSEPFDLRIELRERPYFTRDDLPEMVSVPQPRDGK
jgi:HEAT repeat protein